jgi:oxygen-independent coproporphyrinogen-3 oxidase
MLSMHEINKIIDTLKAYFIINTDVEITLEANPDDVNEEKLKSLKNETPINRLSIGIQSFFDDDLLYLNRVHNSNQAVKSVKEVQKAGFDNLTIDLIYGIPTLTNHKWKENLNRFFDFGLPHLSSYALTIEPKTVLNTLINKGKMPAVDEELSIGHFKLLLEETENHNYIHYEISNFAKEGYYSKHNSIYWLGGHYLGFGPSAHSFNGKSRQWNVSNMKRYIEADILEKFVEEKEVLTTDQQYNEYVMTSIRTSWGCDVEHIKNVFGERYKKHFDDAVKTIIVEEKLKRVRSQYFLTRKGKLFADAIASELFV